MTYEPNLADDQERRIKLQADEDKRKECQERVVRQSRSAAHFEHG